jgi:hypothetical protein
VNTGGGGGGGNLSNTATTDGGAGGSGVVLLRYPNTVSITLGTGLTGTTAAGTGTNAGFNITTITAGTGDVSWS